MLPGRRDFTGQWIPGVFLESDVEGVALPVEGDEREVLPEGLRGKNTKRFLLAMETAAELSPDGDIIEHGRKLFRVQTVKKWAGFWEVLGDRRKHRRLARSCRECQCWFCSLGG